VDDITPVFVKIEEYKEVMDIIAAIRKKIDAAMTTVADIRQLKDEEDRELAAWTANLDDVMKKIDAIDQTIFHKK